MAAPFVAAWFSLLIGADVLVAQPQAAAAEEPIRFDIWGYEIDGNELLDAAEVEQVVYPFLGPAKTIDDVEGARVALEDLFRDRGYQTVLVEIPEQDIGIGVVRLKVIPGRIERLKVSGSRYFLPSRIKSKVPALAEGEVIYTPDVAEQLNELNRLSRDRQVQPELSAGREPGTVRVELKVKDQFPLHGSVEVNDRDTRDTSRLRTNASLTYTNLFQREHSLTASFQTAPQNMEEVQAISASYLLRLPNSDRLLSVYGVVTESDVATFGTLGVIGTGTVIGARLVQPLPVWGDYFQNFTLGFDYKDFDEGVSLLGGDTLNTPIDYWLASLRYDGTRFGESSETRLGLQLVASAEGLGNVPDEFEFKRFQAVPDFTYLLASLNYREAVGRGEVRLRLDGQVTSGPLISNEQFSVGGMDSVRGYFQAQELADEGFSGSLEWFSPSQHRYFGEYVQQLRASAFVDGGVARTRQPLPGTTSLTKLYSAGVGVDMVAFGGLLADLDWAVPFRDSDDAVVESGQSRVHFKVGYDF